MNPPAITDMAPEICRYNGLIMAVEVANDLITKFIFMLPSAITGEL
jgi:hypothetical protein